MAAAKRQRCKECGAELTLRPGSGCPLCGTDRDTAAISAVGDVASYQSDLRKLRAQLRALRGEDAGAA